MVRAFFLRARRKEIWREERRDGIKRKEGKM